MAHTSSCPCPSVLCIVPNCHPPVALLPQVMPLPRDVPTLSISCEKAIRVYNSRPLRLDQNNLTSSRKHTLPVLALDISLCKRATDRPTFYLPNSPWVFVSTALSL